MPGEYSPIAKAILVAAGLIGTLLAMVGGAPLEIAASGACLGVIVLLLWRGRELPILLLPALFQWSEVAIVPISTVWRGIPLNQLSQYGANLESSAIYGLLGVTALSVGMALSSGRSSGIPFSSRVRRDATTWSFQQVAKVSLSAIFVGYVFAAVATVAGPARELFNQAGGLKYVGLFTLAYWCMLQRQQYRMLVVVIALEVSLGMSGFFAEFKNSLLTLLVAALAARPRLRGGDVAVVVVSSGLLLFVAIFWSSVKVDYRPFLNRGTGAQVVLVPLQDRLAFLADAAISMDTGDLADGFNRLISRHGYIDYLALTMEHVPARLPHEGGRLSRSVLEHVAMPRVLFPNKPPLPSDTLIMAHYTGLPYTWNSNTSISIGYLGELYIDFGVAGGLLAAALVGLMAGYVYRILRDARGSALLGAGLCLMAVLPLAYFGTAYAKLVGAFVFSAAIALVVRRFALPIIVTWNLGLSTRASRSRLANGGKR